MVSISFDDLRTILPSGLSLAQLYEGAKDGDTVLIPPVQQRQDELVNSTIDTIIQIAAENVITELCPPKGPDMESEPVWAALKSQRLIPQHLSHDDYKRKVKLFYGAYNMASGQYSQMSMATLLVAYLRDEGFLQKAIDLVPAEEVARYNQLSEHFRISMDEYRQELKSYISYLEKEYYPFIVKDLSEPPTAIPIKDRKEQLDKITNYIDQVKIYGEEIEYFRDGGVFPETPATPAMFKLKPMPLSLYHSVPVHPAVRCANAYYYETAGIRETSHKVAESALRKWKSRGNPDVPLDKAIVDFRKVKLLDINRITVIPHTPAIADRFASLTADPIHYDGVHFTEGNELSNDHGWYINSRGYIDRKIYPVSVSDHHHRPPLCSEIKLEEDYQLLADIETHEVYSVLRLMLDANQQFDINHINLSLLETIHEKYLTVMRRFGNHVNRYATVDEPLTLEDFGAGPLRKIEALTLEHTAEDGKVTIPGEKHEDLHRWKRELSEKLIARFDDLIRLNQSIHVAAAENAESPDWKELYVREGYRRNHDAGRDVIPEEFLTRILPERASAIKESVAQAAAEPDRGQSL